MNGTDLQTCLGDLFSVNWMEAVFLNCSGGGPGAHRCTESLALNFNQTASWTNLSSPQRYGDLAFQSSAVGGWVSNGRAPFPPTGAVSARDAAAVSLRARSRRDARAHAELLRTENLERKQGAAFHALARTLGAPVAAAVAFPVPFSEWDCYRAANEHVVYTDASWALAKVVAAACAADPASAPAALAAACAEAGGCKAA